MSRPEFVVRSFIIVGVLAIAAATWMLSDILLLLFGAILVAVLLRSVADPIERATSLGPTLALAIAVVVIGAVVATSIALLGPALSEQMVQLMDRFPAAWTSLSNRFQLGALPDVLKDASTSSLGSLAARMFSWGSTIVAAIASLALVVFGGLYLAAAPQTYRNGVIALVPGHLRAVAKKTLNECGEALRRWLSGQLVAMLLIGVLTGLGLWVVGVPSALALGLIAGLFAFVPIFGPFWRWSQR